MSRRTAAIVAWASVAVSTVLGLAGTGMKVAVNGWEGWHFVANDGLAICVFFASAAVGGLVVSRLPSNRVGWIFLGLVVTLGFSGATDGYVYLSQDRGRVDGLVQWAAVYSADVFLALLATLLLVLLLFPNGRLLTPRWRLVLWAGLAATALVAVSVVTRPGKLEDYPQITSPIGVDSAVLSALGVPGFFLFIGALVGAAVSQVLRFRRSRGVERQQLTLLMAAGIFATTAFVLSIGVDSATGSNDAGIATTLLGILAIPVAVGAAMLRYRLYEIDRVISRTLVYGALTVILGAAYAGLVLAGQAVFSSFAGGSNIAIAGSTLVVAALFLPLRARVQRLVDRRFYRRRYDAQRTLESFGARLRHEVQLEALAAHLRIAVDETVQPAHVSVWLKGGGR